jgi:hypothetical protein
MGALLLVCSIPAYFLICGDDRVQDGVAVDADKHGPFWDKYQQIQLDMTKEQVEALLGPPADEEVWGMGSLCTSWRENGQGINVWYGWNGEAYLVVSKSFLAKPGWWKRWWPLRKPVTPVGELELLDCEPPDSPLH